jgi:hypothetical protein
MWQELIRLWQSIQNAEYAQLLLEPVPLYGLFFGLLFSLWALLLKEGKSLLLGLGLLAASCLSVWWYLKLHTAAIPRILATSAVEFGPMIKEQMLLRQDCAWAYYAGALVALVAFFLQRSRYARRSAWCATLLAIPLLVLSTWLHYQEAKIYHPNIQRLWLPRR